MAAGGENATSALANVESYNGSSWTEVADLNTATRVASGAGTITASLIFGGTTSGPGTAIVKTFEV